LINLENLIFILALLTLKEIRRCYIFKLWAFTCNVRV